MTAVPSLTKFFGASVVSYDSAVGWNEQATTVTLRLVEDVRGGDRFRPAAVGEPCHVQIGGFSFDGLLQRWIKTDDVQAGSTYEAMLTSPNEILGGVQVVLGSFLGKTNAVPNLLNAFGYWEDRLGFGGAMTNESGMLWDAPFSILNMSGATQGGSIHVGTAGTVGVRPAIETMTKSGAGGFGGPVQFRGHSYAVDFGGLPTPPAYYRLGGVSQSVLDMVTAICEDGGYDYVCYLDGHTIRFRCVSRLGQPAIGQIANFVNSRQDVRSRNVGVELRNDQTNAVLIGGDYHQLVQVTNPAGDDTIWPYWGKDADGNVIVGQGMPEVDHQFRLDCSEIADIMGDVSYPCTIPELRLALSSKGFDSWAAHVIRNEPAKAQAINLVGAVDAASDLSTIFGDEMFQKDGVAADFNTVQWLGGMNESDYWTRRAQRVFDFVSKYAQEYYGRKFLVKVPFLVYWKQTPETTQIVASDVPTNDGGYVPEGGLPLGLNFFNEDVYMTEDGRMGCFCRFPVTQDIDLAKLTPQNCVVQDDHVYMRAEVDQDVGVVYPGGSIFPYVVVTVVEPVQQLAPDPLGGIPEIASILGFGTTPDAVVEAAANRFGDFPMQITPAYYRPEAVAVPMRSERVSYGPWGTFPPWGNTGVAGKVSFSRDEGMTPWAYGDVGTMNLAAASQLANATTNMQETETGSVEVAGAPAVSLGDALIAGGPSVTGIRVSMSTAGVVTTYDMRTFTRVFGSFARENADRLKRLGLAANQVRRTIRAMFHRSLARSALLTRARIGFMENTSRAVRQGTPHDVLYGRMTNTKAFGYRTQCAAATYPEAVAHSRGDKKELWQMTGAMSLEGLLRPFSTAVFPVTPATEDDPEATPGLPHYAVITAPGIDAQGTPTQETLDPFSDGTDVDVMAWGDEYPGEMHVKKAVAKSGDPKSGVQPPEYDNARPLGLRAPLVLVGWGYELTGHPIPNGYLDTSEEGADPPPLHEWDTEFMEDHRKHPEQWVAGPLDVRYDTFRKCWAVPTGLVGDMDEDLTSGPSRMNVHVFGNVQDDKVEVYNWLGGTIAKGTRVIAVHFPLENRWYVTSAACSS